MKKRKLPHKIEVFVCCKCRDKGARAGCGAHNGQVLRDRIKALVKARGYRSRIRVNQSGCMDKCDQGANVMIFPENKWLSYATVDDAEDIVDRLIKNLESDKK